MVSQVRDSSYIKRRGLDPETDATEFTMIVCSVLVLESLVSDQKLLYATFRTERELGESFFLPHSQVLPSIQMVQKVVGKLFDVLLIVF